MIEMKPVKDLTKQINIRLRASVIGMLLDGCKATELSQGRFIELCIMRNAGAVPAMLDRMRREALHIITDEMASASSGQEKRRLRG